MDIKTDGAGDLFVGGLASGVFGGNHAGANDVFVLKLNANSGALDTSFGTGDGTDSDGVLQINNGNTLNAEEADVLMSLNIDVSGDLFMIGYTDSSFSAFPGGKKDGFVCRIPSGASGLVQP